ncbi:hypothetical protein [Mycobacterium sp.]|uniref:hypothetical protein n=1 Tax=Mycobacterium sp. TaxID=1785 RepID=UPI003F987587
MVTPTFDISESSRVRSIRSARTDGEYLRYRLDVVATSAADAVHWAGGWLYDRAMAGWEVTVLLPQSCDSRPLRILGVGAMDLESGFERTGSATHSLAVSAEVFAADDRIRETVLNALNHRLTEVALWGEGWPLAVNRGMARVQHVLSAAARTFKGHALAAAGICCDTVDPTETMLYDMAACSPVDFELVRLG